MRAKLKVKPIDITPLGYREVQGRPSICPPKMPRDTSLSDTHDSCRSFSNLKHKKYLLYLVWNCKSSFLSLNVSMIPVWLINIYLSFKIYTLLYTTNENRKYLLCLVWNWKSSLKKNSVNECLSARNTRPIVSSIILTDFRLDPNQTENGKYNLIPVWSNKISKRFLFV